jgi:2-oxoacid:acceptor oxidoreductase delta subunit (pyruvate/2-ketoisovalerate family)
MAELRAWRELPAGGMVSPATAPQPTTGGWRTGVRPEVELSACVNCLLCWLYCPDSAVKLVGTDFSGFDLDYCKGCELCAEVCPTGAISMVEEQT